MSSIPSFSSSLRVSGIALVTGAGSGIGRAASLLLAREACAEIALVDVDPSSIAKCKEKYRMSQSTQISKLLRSSLTSDESSIKPMISTVIETFGRLDYAANCAGIGFKKAIGETETPDWGRIISLNLMGAFLCMREEIRQMQKQAPRENVTYAPLQRGPIVNIASLAAVSGIYHSGAYTAAKHGVLGTTRTGALDHPDVKLNAVVPG